MEAGYEFLLIGLIGGVLIDIMFGDPPNRFHPVSWLGTLIGLLIPRIKGDKAGYNVNKEKLRGVVFVIILVASIGVATQFLVCICLHLIGIAAATVLAA